jgi:tungstate transport system substrate-binding protein
MRNDFVMVGPPTDPARVGRTRSSTAAMRAIAEHGLFVSRGDDSGTHVKELELWRAAEIDPATITRREDTGQGMGATLHIADQLDGYTLTDRGTYLALKRWLRLIIVFERDPQLANVYHAYVVNPAKHPQAKAVAARAFVEFLASPSVQQEIGEFKRAEYGEPLFVPAQPRPILGGGSGGG